MGKGLGPDNKICQKELVEAMRARLGTDGKNVDLPEVQANFGALGQALFQIATVRAKTSSDSAADAEFWRWISDVQTWLEALSTWQQGVAKAFKDWTPTRPAERTLKSKLTAVAAPGDPPAAAPTTHEGRIE